MDKMFLACLVCDGKIIDYVGYELIVKEVNDGYQELITGKVLKSYRDSDDDMTVYLCDRLDPNFNYKRIINYYRYQEDKVRSMLEDTKVRKLINS